MSDKEKEFPPGFEDAPHLRAVYHLPTANYLDAKTMRVDLNKLALIYERHRGKTNATSTKPIIGTTSVRLCTGIILYNKKTKTAVIAHVRYDDYVPLQNHYQHLLKDIRGNDSDQIDVHILGNEFLNDRAVEWDARLNSQSVVKLNNLVQAVMDTPNVTLKTLDVYNKPKPMDVAIDSRDGKLIRGTGLFHTSTESWAISPPEPFSSELVLRCYEQNFDGTQPEYQEQRRRG